MINILRNCLVPNEGQDRTRVNEVYSYGGAGLCINTVHDTFELNIQNHIIIVFDGLIRVVDAAGGIDISLTEEKISYD